MDKETIIKKLDQEWEENTCGYLRHFLCVLKFIFERDDMTMSFGWHGSPDDLEKIIMKHWLFREYHFLLEPYHEGSPPGHGYTLYLFKRNVEERNVLIKLRNFDYK